MRSVCLILLSFMAIIVFGAPCAAQEGRTLPFEDYPVAVWRGKVAPLNLRSHSLARVYKTLIRQQLREAGINFAGHYALASVGCGTGCSITAVINTRNGRAYFLNELNGWTGIVGDYEGPEGEDPWTYRAESRLLKAIGRPHIGNPGEER